ncbi:MAG: hypothetical protein RLZZ502_547, partial [Pseudomonadota bacterium]
MSKILCFFTFSLLSTLCLAQDVLKQLR